MIENDEYAQDVDQSIYTEQAGCIWTPQGRVCRDPRRNIRCFYPRWGGRPQCRPMFGPRPGPGPWRPW